MRVGRFRLGVVVASLAGAGSLIVTAVPGSAAPARQPAASARQLASTARQQGVMTTIVVGRLPDSIAIDQRTGTVWVVNSFDNTVSEISEARQAVVATIKVGISPVDIAADSRTGTIWVTCLGPFGRPAADNTVAEISEASGKVVARITVGGAPFGVAADSRTGAVWVANAGSRTISEISEARQAVVATVHTGKAALDTVAVDPGKGVVWAGGFEGTVDEIGEATRSVIASVEVTPGSGTSSLSALAVDPNTGTPWVAGDSYDGAGYLSYASQVGPASRRVLASVPVPKPGPLANTADGMAADPATGTVWVAENGANMVTLVSEGQDAVARNLPTGNEPMAVAVDSRTGTVWIVNNFDGTVTTYSYSRPSFTTPSRVTFRTGRQQRFGVHTGGFPLAEMHATGVLPPGLRVRLGHGAVIISGKPAAAARGHTFHLTISADNGVGTPTGQYVFTQDLVLRVK
jgi:YVTN family beta-propeller protein